ncbi:MAG: non-ribosomal peptide synthetase [Candidatus Omnitrophota bacterium]
MAYENKAGDAAIAAGQSFKEKKYWMEKFAGEIGDSRFPYDNQHDQHHQHDQHDQHNQRMTLSPPSMDVLEFEFPGDLFESFMKLSNGSDSRLHMILTAGIVALLYKYSGVRHSESITVGIPIDRQNRDGDFINTVLAIRCHIHPNMTYKELLLQVRETIVEAVEHQNYPFDILLHDLGLNETGRCPLFDTTVVLETIQDKNYLRNVRTAMNFVLNVSDKQIRGVVETDGTAYKRSTVERIIDHLKRLMGMVLTNINLSLDDVEILSDIEKETLLYRFNDTQQDVFGHQTIHGLFMEQADKTPDSTAVVYDGYTASYKEIKERVQQLAQELKSNGVTSGVPVGISVTRSVEMVIGLLGILTAGGAYLPIDPGYPSDRIAYMIGDSAMKVLVVNGNWEWCRLFNGTVIHLGVHGNNGNEQACRVFEEKNPEGNYPAYIIYTSGSTGKPKGVLVEHRAITHTMKWRKAYYGFGSGDASLQIFLFSFDGSVLDIFVPLISGAKLVLINFQNQFDMEYLAGLINDHHVTHMLIIPNFYKNFLERIPETLLQLKAVTLAGDHVTEALVNEHFETLKTVKLYNEYGPTENSVCSTVYELKPGQREILIGKPITNTRCVITDIRGRLVPIGVPGELCVSGIGVARGYLNNPELTHDKFIIINPPSKITHNKSFWSHLFSKRWVAEGISYKSYKTSDLARWREDGNIEFLGRIDYQVKIRGYRVEPGEIERQLLRHEHIDDVVVVAKEDKIGEKNLCAYFVSSGEFNVGELRTFLMERLPEYMVPSYFIPLEAMPLNPNGKVDRNRLPEPSGYIKSGVDYEGPRTQLEKTLVDIWKKELGLDMIGIHDNYFNIGGDSIKSIRLINTVNEALNTRLKVVDLYLNNTIEKLALRVDECGKSEEEGSNEFDAAMLELDELKQSIIDGEENN